MTTSDVSSRKPVLVVGVGLHTPRTLRMIVRGDLTDWPEPGPAAQIELFLPDTPVGPVVRWYSVRDWDRERGEIMIDMSLNDGHGPATQWACRVVVGMRLEISGAPRSTFEPASEGGSYLFAGDESALPAIATCLASLPGSARAVALLEVANADERQHLVSRAETRVRWLYRDASEPKQTLAKAIASEVSAIEPSFVWLALESDAANSAKRHLIGNGYPPEQLSVSEYWRRETPNVRDSRAGHQAVSYRAGDREIASQV